MTKRITQTNSTANPLKFVSLSIHQYLVGVNKEANQIFLNYGCLLMVPLRHFELRKC